MNMELKAILAIILDLYKVGSDAVEKKPILDDLPKLLGDLPAVLSNAKNLPSEILELQGSAQEADLISYVVSELSGVTSDAHALAIVKSVLNLASNITVNALALANVIKGK